MGFVFFKLPKHRKYSPSPVYYDEKKEAREELIRQAEQELDIEASNKKGEYKLNPDYVRKKMRRAHEEARSSNEGGRVSLIRGARIILIVGFLIGLLYWVLVKNPKITNLLFN